MLAEYKRYVKFILILMLTLILYQIIDPAEAYAQPDDETLEILERRADTEEVRMLENELKRYAEQGLKEIFPEFDPRGIIKDAAKGQMDLDVAGLFGRIGKYLFHELYINMNVLVKLVVLVVICAVLKNIQSSFMSESVGEIAFYACYIALVSVMMLSLNMTLEYGKQVIDSMVDFMHVSIPILITLLVSGGNLTSAGVFQPILIMIVEVSATIMKNIFIPVVFLSSVLSIVDNISEKVQISRFSKFLNHISGWFLGLVLTIFIAVVSIQGSMGAVIDGVTSKTAKFALGAMIPVAGKYLADAADAVIGCSMLIKNAAGVAVLIGVLGICLIPFVKMTAIMLLYRLACIMVEPIAENRITNSISAIAGSMTFIIGIAASVACMFLISVTAIISAGNISAMMR